MTYLVLAAAAAVLALSLTPAVRVLAARLGVVDAPGGRRVHAGHVPRLGGVALIAATLGAFLLAALAGVPAGERLAGSGIDLRWVLAGTAVVVATGIADDVRALGALAKLALVTLAALLAVAGNCAFAAVTNPFTGDTLALGAAAAVVTVTWIVLITNAFNLIDGLDGLAAGVGAICAAALFVVSLAQDRTDAACVAAAVGGALLGFLVYNFSPATIFLGDSGSLWLGYVLAILAIQGRGKGPAALVVLVPILLLGLPIADTVIAVSRRWRRGGSAAVFRADRDHIHHRLVELGLSPRRAVLLLYAVSATLAALAVAAYFVHGPGSTALLAVAGAGAYLGLRQLGYAPSPWRARSPTELR